MATQRDFPATDSTEGLRDLIGDDATATFEDDPKFIGSAPTGSSENSLAEKEDEDDELEDDETVEDEEDEVDLEDDEEDDDEEEVDDEEFEDDDEEVDADDVEEEDDADEVKAAGLRADGLLGYEDEADDAAKGRSRTEGDASRKKAESALDDDEGDGGADDAVDEDAARQDEELDLDDREDHAVTAVDAIVAQRSMLQGFAESGVARN